MVLPSQLWSLLKYVQPQGCGKRGTTFPVWLLQSPCAEGTGDRGDTGQAGLEGTLVALNYSSFTVAVAVTVCSLS